MPDFSQKHPKVTTFYNLNPNNNLLQDLIQHSRWEKPVLFLPTLATEFTIPKNRPAFENIVAELAGASYLNNIILGVDNATEAEVHQAVGIFKRYGIKNYLVQWNDGPRFSEVYSLIEKAGYDLSLRGKGRNLFMGVGVCIALGATSVGFLDTDIKTFRREQLDRLFFPVVVLGYQFSKAFYARWSDRRLYGRVKRLLLDPLLMALKRKFTESQNAKLLRIVDFILFFNYQLSGEMVVDMSLLKRMRLALNWGVELFTLIEVYRKANQIAQVEFSTGPFDHKHQRIAAEDPDTGLHRMSIDIISILFYALIIEEGLDISDTFFRDLAITYQSIADDTIKKYADNAKFNGFIYDREAEERLVHEVIARAIINAGELLEAPQEIAHRFLHFITSHPEFEPFIDKGLLQTILSVEQRLKGSLSLTGELPEWERVMERIPDVIEYIVDALEGDKRVFMAR
nr:hypothetical protein [Desulfobacterales bacterium]